MSHDSKQPGGRRKPPKAIQPIAPVPSIHERRAQSERPVIHATNGDALTVDPEDYFLLARHRWQGHGSRLSGSLYYAAPLGSGVVYLGHVILPRPSWATDFVQIQVNDDPKDFRKDNLAWVSAAVVRHRTERPKRKPGSSRFRGVFREGRSGLWIASISKEGEKERLGSFTHEVDAARAYNKAAIEMFGRYARLNRIDEDEEQEPARRKA